MIASCGTELYWYGCYSGAFDLITPESVAHPAKMSPKLCFRILEHLEELGLLKPDSVVLDPMAGTGLTALCAGAKGLKAITVELEEKFIGFERANKIYAESRLHHPLDWQIIQGDSRHLSTLLAERGLVTLTSPPYAEAQSGGGISARMRGKGNYKMTTSMPGNCYQPAEHGVTDGQIGNLRDVPLATITSPPYGIADTSGGLNTKPPRSPKDQAGRSPNSPSQAGAKEGYGETEGQIGTLPDKPLATIMSPPYGHDASHDPELLKQMGKPPGNAQYTDGYGVMSGQIGILPDKPLTTITSPPYENMEIVAGQQFVRKEGVSRLYNAEVGPHYSKSEKQLGQEKSESYLSAMALVYSEIARVSNVLVVVIKNPTRGGKLRRLDLDTLAILDKAGWTLRCQHRALLFEEVEQATLDGGVVKKPKGRLSFFKRLSYQKGQPVASWEDVLICERV